MVSRGVVREFHTEEGWGAIDGDDVPGGCWVHFSAIVADGHRRLVAGAAVWFEAEPADQDGFAYRAVVAWPDSYDPGSGHTGGETSIAYRSSLTITFEPPPDRRSSMRPPGAAPCAGDAPRAAGIFGDRSTRPRAGRGIPWWLPGGSPVATAA